MTLETGFLNVFSSHGPGNVKNHILNLFGNVVEIIEGNIVQLTPYV